MKENFKVEFIFDLNDEDKKLYDKYAIPASEFASDGDFLSAIKLIDKILDINPNVEFALLFKANYLSNYTNLEINYPELNSDNIDEIIELATGYKNNYQECIKLIDKALKLNPKNKNAKLLKGHIKKTVL